MPSRTLPSRIPSPSGKSRKTESPAGSVVNGSNCPVMAERKVKGHDLAAQIGITEQNLSLLKSGKVKCVRFETLARLCAALDCPPGDLLEATPED